MTTWREHLVSASAVGFGLLAIFAVLAFGMAIVRGVQAASRDRERQRCDFAWHLARTPTDSLAVLRHFPRCMPRP